MRRVEPAPRYLRVYLKPSPSIHQGRVQTHWYDPHRAPTRPPATLFVSARQLLWNSETIVAPPWAKEDASWTEGLIPIARAASVAVDGTTPTAHGLSIVHRLWVQVVTSRQDRSSWLRVAFSDIGRLTSEAAFEKCFLVGINQRWTWVEWAGWLAEWGEKPGGWPGVENLSHTESVLVLPEP